MNASVLFVEALGGVGAPTPPRRQSIDCGRPFRRTSELIVRAESDRPRLYGHEPRLLRIVYKKQAGVGLIVEDIPCVESQLQGLHRHSCVKIDDILWTDRC